MDDRKIPSSPWEGVRLNPRQLFNRSLWYAPIAIALGVQSFRSFEPLTAGILTAAMLALSAAYIVFRHKRLKVYEAVRRSEEEARQRLLSESDTDTK